LKEELVENADSVIWCLDFVANRARVLVNFVIVATGLTFVTEKVNFIEIFLYKLQAIALVPALGEYVE